MNFDFKGKNILITGGAGGIGSAITKTFHALGGNVVISGTNEVKIVKYANQFNQRISAFKADLKEVSDIEKLVENTCEKFDNKIDVLVNNAGITRDNLVLRMKEAEWHEVINLNLSGSFFLIKNILRHMIKSRYGRIINITSVVGSSGNIGQSNYSASKAGIEGMSKSIALEVASRNITVNCVAPGFIETEMTKSLLEKHGDNFFSKFGTGLDCECPCCCFCFCFAIIGFALPPPCEKRKDPLRFLLLLLLLLL